MDNITVFEKGYTVIYDGINGTIGYIGIGSHSGRHYFTGLIDSGHVVVYKTIGEAQRLLDSSRKMTTYYGASKVQFNTMRIVKMSTVFQETNDELEKIFFEEAKSKLTKADFDIIKSRILENKQ